MARPSVHRGQIVGMRLQAARQKSGLSPLEVSERFGVSSATVLNWEAGRAIPKHERLADLADLYGVSTEWLISSNPEKQESFRDQYVVLRSDGQQDDPDTKYFVLRVNSDPCARVALDAYRRSISLHDPKLAEEISAWLTQAR